MRFCLKTDLEKSELMGELKALGFETTGEDSKTGRLYLEFYGDPLSPTVEIPEVPKELVAFVTHRERIYRGFRLEGIYVKGESQLLVRTQRRVIDTITGSNIEVDEWQDLDIRAPSIEELIEIYKLVRTGELQPESDWEQEAAPAEA